MPSIISTRGVIIKHPLENEVYMFNYTPVLEDRLIASIDVQFAQTGITLSEVQVLAQDYVRPDNGKTILAQKAVTFRLADGVADTNYLLYIIVIPQSDSKARIPAVTLVKVRDR